jgi:hypothetical protein
MLGDREKFVLAKNNRYIDILLELIQSNETVARGNSFVELSNSGKTAKLMSARVDHLMDTSVKQNE